MSGASGARVPHPHPHAEGVEDGAVVVQDQPVDVQHPALTLRHDSEGCEVQGP